MINDMIKCDLNGILLRKDSTCSECTEKNQTCEVCTHGHSTNAK